MSFTTITTTQNEFLETHLRGTGRTMSAKQAAATYGIKNLSARISELRQLGLRINRAVNSTGRSAYSISARDIVGSRAKLYI